MGRPSDVRFSRDSDQLLCRVGAVQVRPLGARQNAELDDAP